VRCSLDREGDDCCCIRCHEELYAFMNGHKRNDVFMQAQGDGRAMQLKRVTTTRWNSTVAAVETVFRKFDAVLGALEQLSHCTGDSPTVTSAIGLRKRLRDIRVILCMNILKINSENNLSDNTTSIPHATRSFHRHGRCNSCLE